MLVSSPIHPYHTNAFSVNSISDEDYEDYVCVVISIVLKNNEKKKDTPSS